MIDFFSLIGISLEYAIILVFAWYVIGCKPRATWMPFLAFVLYMVWAVVPWSQGGVILAIVNWLYFILIYFVAPKWIFPGFKLRYMFLFFLFYFCYQGLVWNVICLLLGSSSQRYGLLMVLTEVFCFILLFSPVRHILRQIYLHTTAVVHIIVMVVLFASFGLLTDVELLFAESPNDPLVRQFFAGTLILTAVLTIVFPVAMFIASTNKQLRALTASYEGQIQAQAAHYQSLAASNFEIRRFRHDYKNTRIAIEQLLAQGKTDQALEVLQSCEDALRAPNTLFDTGNGIADALLTDKQQLAALQYAEIRFRGSIPSNVLAPTDVCVLLGNTLDNAIEACAKLTHDEKHIISVTSDCSSGFLFLTIKNPIRDRVIIQNNQVMTTKEDKAAHGFGIQSLHNVAKKYQGSVKLNADDGYFTVSIDLCLPTQ